MLPGTFCNVHGELVAADRTALWLPDNVAQLEWVGLYWKGRKLSARGQLLHYSLSMFLAPSQLMKYLNCGGKR